MITLRIILFNIYFLGVIEALRVALYQHAEFAGKTFIADLPAKGCVDLPEFFREEASSIEVRGSGCATVFTGTGCGLQSGKFEPANCGRFNETHKGLRNLARTNMNDRISSIALCGATKNNEKCGELQSCLDSGALCEYSASDKDKDMPCCSEKCWPTDDDNTGRYPYKCQ